MDRTNRHTAGACLRRIAYIIALSSVMIACGNGTKAAQAQEPVPPMTELPLPAMPDSLRTPQARAAYLALHFWDALDFAADSEALDTAFMEQSFANYLSVADIAEAPDAAAAMRRLAGRAVVAPEAFDLLEYVADRYLDNPNSPMRSEKLYEHWLNALRADSALYAGRAFTIDSRLHRIAMNRPGTVAADFGMLILDGRRTTMHGTLGKGRTLLMFYDPACENCHSIRRSLAAASMPEDISIVAVAVDGTQEQWRADAAEMPAGWTVGYALDALEARDIYFFAALPTFYLLDSGGTVLLKDPAPASLFPQ